ncbi:hypothetical protein ACSBR2_010582 [Camellia fascicularis]
MKITYAGVELIDSKSGDLHWCLDFRDMDSPAIIFLSDAYEEKNVEHGGFVLCPLYGRKSKAFQAASGTSNTAIISNLTKTVSPWLGCHYLWTVLNHSLLPTKEAVQAEETPCGALSVTRLRSATHGALNIPGLSLGVGPKGGLGEQGCYCSSLIYKNSLVRFAEEPQMFAIEFNDGCPILVYGSTSRDSLLVAVRDLLQTEDQCPIPVLPSLTMPGHRIDPPCGRVPLQIMQFYVGKSPVADMETATTHLKHFAAAAKDADLLTFPVATLCFLPIIRGQVSFMLPKNTRTIASTFVPVIDLSCNQLTSVVPTQIGNLRGIARLNLSNDLLTGHNSPKF